MIVIHGVTNEINIRGIAGAIFDIVHRAVGSEGAAWLCAQDRGNPAYKTAVGAGVIHGMISVEIEGKHKQEKAVPPKAARFDAQGEEKGRAQHKDRCDVQDRAKGVIIHLVEFTDPDDAPKRGKKQQKRKSKAAQEASAVLCGGAGEQPIQTDRHQDRQGYRQQKVIADRSTECCSPRKTEINQIDGKGVRTHRKQDPEDPREHAKDHQRAQTTRQKHRCSGQHQCQESVIVKWFVAGKQKAQDMEVMNPCIRHKMIAHPHPPRGMKDIHERQHDHRS